MAIALPTVSILAFPCILAAQELRLEEYEPVPFSRHYLVLPPIVDLDAGRSGQERDEFSSGIRP